MCLVLRRRTSLFSLSGRTVFSSSKKDIKISEEAFLRARRSASCMHTIFSQAVSVHKLQAQTVAGPTSRFFCSVPLPGTHEGLPKLSSTLRRFSALIKTERALAEHYCWYWLRRQKGSKTTCADRKPERTMVGSVSLAGDASFVTRGCGFQFG